MLKPSTILAMDPGHQRTAIVRLSGRSIQQLILEPNEAVAQWLFERGNASDGGELLVIEQMESFGMAVGREVFETVFWAGRFAEAWGRAFDRMPRRIVKTTLCRTSRATDSNVRQALIDMYGPTSEKAVGNKKAPGPLFGVKADLWAALALGVAWQQQQREKETVIHAV